MKSPDPKLDLTPALARQVIDLYATELADVRFPDLELADLLQVQAELHDAQLEVESIEATLVEARSAVEARLQALTAKAERALSYARVFAQGNAALAPRIAEIGRKKASALLQDMNGLSGSAAAPKRGRRPKSDVPSELFNEGSGSEEIYMDAAPAE